MIPRWRLFTKYAAFIIALVSAALIASGGVSLYFSYRENQDHLINLQREKALAAATRIEQYISDIEHQLGWTALPQVGAGANPVEQRRYEYLKLLRQAPAITEVAWIDASGREQLRVSRLAMDVVSSGTDFTKDPKFAAVKAGKTWYSSVYFRKETEPYMTISRPAGGAGGGITVAEVNLKFVWEVVSRIQIGKAGLAYVVNSDGTLIAHPDISLVLQKTDLSKLAQVAAAARGEAESMPIAHNVKGEQVLTAHAGIPTLQWTVFVELPLGEAFAPLYASILRIGLLLLAGLVLSMLASVYLARVMVNPIRALQAGAARIGTGQLDQRIEVHTGDELEALAEQFNKMAADLKSFYSGLERKVEERTTELKESLEQQTATADILRVISSSPTNIQPVFEAILQNATRLCDAHMGTLRIHDGKSLRRAATHGVPPAYAKWVAEEGQTLAPRPEGAIEQMYATKKPVHILDRRESPGYLERRPSVVAMVELAGVRTFLAVPMLKEGRVVGAIVVHRPEVRAFTQKQIDLLATFADQAVIAIENVRLFNETKEALEQQTVISEILRVISSSPTDTQPVFDAIVKSGVHLFGGMNVTLRLVKGDHLESVASTLPLHDTLGAFRSPVGDESMPASRAILRREVVQIPDYLAPEEWLAARAIQQAEKRGFRALMSAPMLREDKAIGTINVIRATPGLFTDKQIALLRTFASQAVIAIENVRLFKELQARNAEVTEALEQQTVTADILKVISSSPTDVQPVFDAIAENAARLCDANDVVIRRVEGDMTRIVAHMGSVPVEPEGGPRPLSLKNVAARAILERRTIHIPDFAHAAVRTDYPDSLFLSHGGEWVRTVLVAPLLREGAAIGAIIMRRRDPVPFTDKQIALLETFAAQAVIAIENVRLFNETKEALDRQTGTAEILRVISDNPTDVMPVLDAVTHRAAQLCDAPDARLYLVEGNVVNNVAGFGASKGAIPVRPLSRDFVVGRAVIDQSVVHIEDIVTAFDDFPGAREPQRKFGNRTMLAVPLMRENRAFGAILMRRKEVRPFTEKQIELVKTFADQAVIAIENVRLFNETKEALEQQTATAEVLKVISSSPTDVQPVFDAIVRSGVRLFNGKDVFLRLVKGDHTEVVASTEPALLGENLPTLLNDDRRPSTRTILRREVVQIPDVLATDWILESTKARARARGNRALLYAPMLREGNAIGAIGVVRSTPGPFTDKEVALLKTFADQAVIAIENVRLFKELQARNAEVTESLEQQTAIAEVLRVISSSPTDVMPVLDAVAVRAARICDAFDARMMMVEGDSIRRTAGFGNVPVTRSELPLTRESASGRAIIERVPVHIEDGLALDPDDFPITRENAERGGFRTVLAIPLMREDKALGCILLRRKEKRLFSDKHVALLQTFADQAAIAIENVRLFRETNEALEQQTVTADILKVISSSLTDTQPVFDAIVKSGVHLFGGLNVTLRLVRGDRVELVASTVPVPDDGGAPPFRSDDDRYVGGRTILRREVVHVPDVFSEVWVGDGMKQLAAHRGYRAILAAPLLRDGNAIGLIAVSRATSGPFTDKQIALLKTFADQAVIAIENVRLFNETKEALEQQTATAEILGVISSSPTDVQPVFDAIVQSAVRLFHGNRVRLFLVEGKNLCVRGTAGTFSFDNTKDDVGFSIPLDRDSVIGRAVLDGKTLQVPDYEAIDIPRPAASRSRAWGIRSTSIAPLMREGVAVGAITVPRAEPGELSEKEMALLKTFADQAVIAIENVRLFKEIQDKSRQLEVANKHKSDFLANMSHELRTPLNAIIGFSEALLEKMFGEMTAKQEDYLKDIHSSGRHLLSLINDILDLSKVEAGRMELDLAEFNLPSALENAITLVRERAHTHGIALKLKVDSKLGEIRADERKFKQIVVNLLSNAVKFTPDGGRVEVDARRNGSSIEVSVKDTGVGIAPEDQEVVFEEFKQVGRDYTNKQEGTGLGLALTRRFVELHGGKISLKSAPGKGSTFTFTLPLNQ